jgi:hypothetical protein
MKYILIILFLFSCNNIFAKNDPDLYLDKVKIKKQENFAPYIFGAFVNVGITNLKKSGSIEFPTYMLTNIITTNGLCEKINFRLLNFNVKFIPIITN